MNTSGDAAEQVVRLSLEGFEVAAKITGSGAKNVAALLYAIMKDKQKTAGKTNLTNMLKSGKELNVFSVRNDEFKKFAEEAKRYGVLYSALINRKTKANDGIIDIMVRSEDAAKINRIVERFKLASYDEVSIRSEIEKTRESKKEKSPKDIGIMEKSKDDKNLDELAKEPLKKEKESLNPHLAKTEKSPLLKPSLKTLETSNRVTKAKEKPSVKVKLERAKLEVKKREKSKAKEEVSKAKIKKHQSKEK